ncbi:MAG: Rrf2 family transcriptional regulator, partial [Lachnospiraceae bacterium]|nr:Rrf2 family transcriptional regulator [Lachnospiraceae bacterium]
GVHLAREPKDITLWDIYQAVETPDADEIFKMYEGSDACPVGKNFYQILYPHMESAVNAMKADMEQVTLETLKEELQSLLMNCMQRSAPQIFQAQHQNEDTLPA